MSTFVATRMMFDRSWVSVKLKDPAFSYPSYDALDALSDETTKHVHIQCQQPFDASHPQLDLLREKLAMMGYARLDVRINATISGLQTLLGCLSGAFSNNRWLMFEVSGCRLNLYSDGDMWEPCISDFIESTPTLHTLDLGYLNNIPHNLTEAIIRHENLRELRLKIDHHPDVNTHLLHHSVANVISRGTLVHLSVVLDEVDSLPECYEQALRGRGGSSLEVLDIGLEYGNNRDIAVPMNLQRQLCGILCSDLSVNHIVQSNHRLHTFVREERIDNAILRMAASINNNYDNDFNSGDYLEMWKIRSKCFLCAKAMNKWIANLGRNSNDEGANVRVLNRKIHVIQWLTRPDGYSGDQSLSWTFKFLRLHLPLLLSYYGTERHPRKSEPSEGTAEGPQGYKHHHQERQYGGTAKGPQGYKRHHQEREYEGTSKGRKSGKLRQP